MLADCMEVRKRGRSRDYLLDQLSPCAGPTTGAWMTMVQFRAEKRAVTK